jgi:AraC-like DNA-binding protein
MKAAIFNIHDLALVLVIGECLMLALLLVVIQKGKRFSNHLLALFLLLNAFIAFETLIFWSESLNARVASISPNLFFLLGFSMFLEGPILYWYTQSLIYKDFRLRPESLLHLLPALLYPFYMYIFYYRLDHATKEVMLIEQSILVASPFFEILLWLQRCSVIIYGILCLYQLLQYRVHLKNNYSSIEKIDFSWLGLLIGGFLTAWFWVLLTQIIAGTSVPLSISDSMGIIGNYLIFILINSLVFYSLVHSDVFEGVSLKSQARRADDGEPIAPEHVESLDRIMREEKPYLEPNITLERLADRLRISPRLLSAVINRHFKQNFFEFINYHRVERAKELLTSEEFRHHTILDLMAEAGFNSKSASNRFFKKFADMTPTEYRQKHVLP